jgi:hypothetical protein
MQSDDNDTPTPTSFGQRHGLKILGIIMALAISAVIFVQVGC